MAPLRIISVFLAFGIIGCLCEILEPCEYDKSEYDIAENVTRICDNEKSSNYEVIEESNFIGFINENKVWLSSTSNKLSYDVNENEKSYSYKENCYPISLTREPIMLEVENKSYYIMQSDTYKQQITYVKCKNLHKPCYTQIFGYSETSRTKTRCMERTTAISLYAYDPETKNVVLKRFDIPVACTCLMRNVF